jgi:hypothetical protein
MCEKFRDMVHLKDHNKFAVRSELSEDNGKQERKTVKEAKKYHSVGKSARREGNLGKC